MSNNGTAHPRTTRNTIVRAPESVIQTVGGRLLERPKSDYF